MVDLDDLEAKAKAATSGSWSRSIHWVLAADNGRIANVELASNTAFIAAANPQVVLELIERDRGGYSAGYKAAIADVVAYLRDSNGGAHEVVCWETECRDTPASEACNRIAMFIELGDAKGAAKGSEHG